MNKQKAINHKTPAELLIEELKLNQGEYSTIGKGAETQPWNVAYRDKTTASTWVSYNIVSSATFLYLLTVKQMREVTNVGPSSKYRMIPVAGDSGSAQGGTVFVLEGTGLSPKGLSVNQQFDFLLSLIDFQTNKAAIASLNIITYLAASKLFKIRFSKLISYDWLKVNLRRHSNLGPTLFCEPSIIFEGIALINDARNNKDWTEEDTLFYGGLESSAWALEMEDPEILLYEEICKNPNYIDPTCSDDGVITPKEEPVLFQEPFEPNEKVVTPYDPTV